MKKIEAIIRLARFDKVRDELANIGIRFFTMRQVSGFGLQQGTKRVYRGSIYDTDYIARLQLDIITEEENVDKIVEAILKSARTGESGDGKITILDVVQITRIRNGATGKDAL